jgi:hypothetical protein
MARTLYRIYLYFVFTLLLFFAAVATSIFLAILFQRLATSPRDYGYDNLVDLRQPAVFASVALVMTAIFGGLHYWLIRQDIARDPHASRGAVRALFLNFVELVSALTVAIAGAAGFTALQYGGSGAAGAFGPVVAFGVLFALVEVERRRGQPERGAALIIQRLHFYGNQLSLLFIAAGFTLNAMTQTVDQIILSTGYAANPCATPNQYGGCYYSVPQNIGGAWLASLWILAIWGAYGVMTRNDRMSRLRAVYHFGAIAYGVVLFLVGIGEAAQPIMRHVFGAQDPASASYYYGTNDPGAAFANAQIQFQFVAPLLFGLAVVAAYWLWARADARRGAVLDAGTAQQTTLAITAALAALPFWVGCALTLGGLFESAVPDGSPPSPGTWASYLSILIAGILYVPLALWLGALARQTGISTPRRGFVYVLLALGTLGAVFSLIVLVYAVVTSAIGSPLSNWQQLGRQGVANIVIGAIIVGLYVFIARREGWFARQPAHAEATIPASQRVETIEGVLDDLLAQRLSRDEAAARIRTLTGRTTP